MRLPIKRKVSNKKINPNNDFYRKNQNVYLSESIWNSSNYILFVVRYFLLSFFFSKN